MKTFYIDHIAYSYSLCMFNSCTDGTSKVLTKRTFRNVMSDTMVFFHHKYYGHSLWPIGMLKNLKTAVDDAVVENGKTDLVIIYK